MFAPKLNVGKIRLYFA